MEWTTVENMTDDDLFARPPRSARRAIKPLILPKNQSCAVCNLRTDVLICRECADDPQSLARVNLWLSKLGTDAAAQIERARLTRAKELLKTL